MSDANPLPVPAGTTNRITTEAGNGATPAAPVATIPRAAGAPAFTGNIATLDDVLAFLAQGSHAVVIAVAKPPGTPGGKPLAVTVLHAGSPQDAVKLAGVAGAVLQNA